MLQNKNLISDLFIRQTGKKIAMAHMRKFKNYLNCHNFGCVQDRVVIFGFRIGFSGCLLYTSPSPRDRTRSRMPSSA